MTTAIQKLYSEEILMTETDEAIKSLYIQTMGSEPHHRMGKQRMIIEILGAQDVLKAQEVRPQEKKQQPVMLLSQERINEVLSGHIARGLKVIVQDNTWTMKNGAAMDSGHVSVPVDLLKVIADGLMRARMPAKVKIEGEEMFA